MRLSKTNKTDQPRRYPENYTHTGKRLNWLRASVLGANDGIVSIAGLIAGVAGASSSSAVILLSGVAGIVAGAISMAAGEYVSVSSQRDTEKALIEQEREENKYFPVEEKAELAMLYEAKGLSGKTAHIVADELTEKDALSAHLDIEHGLDQNELTNPWHAAIASALAFLSGALIPLFAVILPPASLRMPVMFVAVVFALAITGTISAHYGGASKKRATIRVVIGGALAMVVTYLIGRLVGVSGL